MQTKSAPLYTRGVLRVLCWYVLDHEHVCVCVCVCWCAGHIWTKEAQRDGESQRQVKALFDSCWNAATLPDPVDEHKLPFSADAIIANYQALAHYHVAEALGVCTHRACVTHAAARVSVW